VRVKTGKAGRNLGELINKAIEDLEVTTTEYNEIMALAEKDHHVDASERAVLQHCHAMLADGTLKRVPG
jgi:hypothetical protein